MAKLTIELTYMPGAQAAAVTIKCDTSGSESEAETMAAKYLAHDMAKNYMPRILPPLTQTVLDVLSERKTTEENTHVTH